LLKVNNTNKEREVTKLKKSQLLIASCLGVALASPANSQSAIEEIVVTATKRESSIQDVPFSINAQTAQDIQRTGATSLEDLSRNVAGLAIQNLGPGQSQVSIRGVSAGQIVRDQPGVKEQVGIYLDESVISLSLFTPDLDLFDLNRVETLRGPQGTLFGSGSVGGTIRYITNQPDFERTENGVEVNFNTVDGGSSGGHIKGFFNTPLANGKAAFRGVAYHTEYAGFIDAVGPAGGNDVNDGSRTGGRFSLAYKVNENLTITPRIIIQEIDTDGNNRSEEFNFLAAAQGIELGDREQFLLLREGFEDDIVIADLKIEASFNGFDLTSITSYTDRDILVSRDGSALTHSVSVDLGLDEAVNSIPSNLIDETDLSQFTQEIRLSSNNESAVSWVVGAFYSDTQRDYGQRLPTPGFDAFFDAAGTFGLSESFQNGFPADSPFNSDLEFDLEQISVFGEVNYQLSNQLQLTIGGRYYDFDEDRVISSGGFFANRDTNAEASTDSDGFNSRILLSYQANENFTINAQASEGFRLGGVNDPLNGGICNPEDLTVFSPFQLFGDEELTNYEVGFKANYGVVQINAAAFYSDIDDLQVNLDAGSCSSRVSMNVPEAHTAGVEFELRTVPIEGLDISFAFSALEAEFDSEVLDLNGNVIEGIEDGNRLASVPEFSGSATVTYSFPTNLFGNAGDAFISSSLQYVGDRITQPGDQVEGAGIFMPGLPSGLLTGTKVNDIDLELDSYELVNVNFGFQTDSWDAVFYINNVFDEDAELSFDRERGGRARLGFRSNQPRTFGVTLRTSF